MKKFLFAMIAFAAVLSFAACNDSETYKDMRDRELDSISSFCVRKILRSSPRMSSTDVGK